MNTIPIYLFYMFKSFTPFSPFLVPYLIDVKKFKNKEIYNTLNVYFFVSSLAVSLIAFLIVKFFGNRLSLFVDTFIEIIAYFLLYLMGDRDFFLGRIISTLHGSSTALNSVLKSVVVSNSGDNKHARTAIMNNITIFKCVASVFSSWIGQDIFISIKKYDLNLIISGLTLLFSVCMTFFIHQNEAEITVKKSVVRELIDNLSLIRDFELLSHCLLSITANILVICLSFFSANVFIERRRCGRNSVAKHIFYVMVPLRFFSKCIIKIYTALGGQIKEVEEDGRSNKKELVIHGYIDGISKICSAIICFLMGSLKISDNLRYPLSIGITGLTIASLFFLYIVDSLSMSYLFFTIAFSLSTSIKIILYTSYNSHEYKNFIFSLNMFVSSLIHIILSCLSIYKKSDVKQRFRYYFYVCLFLTFSSILLSCLK